MFAKPQGVVEGSLQIRWQRAPQNGTWEDLELHLQAVIGEPKLVCSVRALSFGTCFLKRTVNRKLEIKNDGTCVLDFKVETGPRVRCSLKSGSLEAGESILLAARFCPRDLQSLQESLRISSDGGGALLPCSGVVLLPQITFPSKGITHDFGLCPLRSQLEWIFEISHSGGGPEVTYLLSLDSASVPRAATLLAQAESDLVSDTKSAASEFDASTAVDTADFDKHIEEQRVAREEHGLSPLRPDQPLQCGAFHVFPWTGVIAPHQTIKFTVTAKPQKVCVLERARLVLAQGGYASASAQDDPDPDEPTMSKQESAGSSPQSWVSYDLRLGALEVVGAGPLLQAALAVEVKQYDLWRLDLGINPETVFVSGVAPLGLVGIGAKVVDTHTVSVRNTGNTKGRWLLKDSGPVKTDGSFNGNGTFRVTPTEGELAPGESRQITVEISAAGPDFISQPFELLSPDCSERETITLMVFAANAHLAFTESSLAFHARQTTLTHALLAPLKNSGNVRASYVAKILEESSEPLRAEDQKADTLLEVGVFELVTSKGSVAPQHEAGLEIQFTPTRDRVLYKAKVVVEWLGKPFFLDLTGVGSTATVSLSFPPLGEFDRPFASQDNMLVFSRCQLYEVHWQTITLKNTGSMTFPFTVDTPDKFLRFRESPLREAVLGADGAELQLEVGVILDAPIVQQGGFALAHRLHSILVSVVAQGGMFACIAEQPLAFGEVGVTCQKSLDLKVANTGDFGAYFTFTLKEPAVQEFLTLFPPRLQLLADDDPAGSSASGAKHATSRTTPSPGPLARTAEEKVSPAAALSDTLTLFLAPGRSLFLPVRFLAPREVALSAYISMTVDLPRVAPMPVKVTALGVSVQLTVNDLSEVNVGKVRLGLTKAVARTLANRTRNRVLDFEIKITCVDAKHAQYWSVSPAAGRLSPGESTEFAISFTSADPEEGIWHEAELVIYNQTEKLVDARFGLRASAAFPRLEVNGAVDGRKVLTTKDDEGMTVPEWPFGARLLRTSHFRDFTVRNKGMRVHLPAHVGE